jgi:hypothetical protein
MTLVRRLRQILVVAVAWASLGANAAAKGSKAEQAANRAMNELFSSAAFDEARDELKNAIAQCSGCSKQEQAVLHADLGIVFITGFHDTKSGSAEMRKARTLDPRLSLDPAFVTDEVKAVFDAAGTGKPSPLEREVDLEDEPEEHEEVKKKHPAADEESESEPECSFDDDCRGGKRCKAGVCETPPAPVVVRERSVWLSIGLIQDFGFVSGSNVCTENSQVKLGYTCLRASGSQYHGTPLSGSGGTLGFGPSLATTRITLASYFALSDKVSGGLRMGYAFAGGAPTPDGGKKFFPLLAEIQGAYWLSQKAFSTKNVGTFIELSGGLGQMVGHGSVTVRENLAVPPNPTQLDNTRNNGVQKLDAYQNSGLGFFGGGLGVFIPFGAGSALIADLRLAAFFPTSGAALSLGAGMAFGP